MKIDVQIKIGSSFTAISFSGRLAHNSSENGNAALRLPTTPYMNSSSGEFMLVRRVGRLWYCFSGRSLIEELIEQALSIGWVASS